MLTVTIKSNLKELHIEFVEAFLSWVSLLVDVRIRTYVNVKTRDCFPADTESVHEYVTKLRLYLDQLNVAFEKSRYFYHDDWSE